MNNNTTEYVDEIKKVNGCDNPYYFSHDFSMFLKFEANQGLTWAEVVEEATKKQRDVNEMKQSHESQPPQQERFTIKIYETNITNSIDPNQFQLGQHP